MPDAPRPYDPACIFCRIGRGEAPASIVYRDADVIAFMDIRPVNPGHVLVVPIAHAGSLADLAEHDGQPMFSAAQRLAGAVRRSGARCDGVNLYLADGVAAGQEVFHVHLHVLPRFAGDGIRLAAFGRQQSPSHHAASWMGLRTQSAGRLAPRRI